MLPAKPPGGDQLVAHLMMTMKDNIEILSHEDDDIALESAAAHCRLPHDRLTTQELACFPDIAQAGRPTHSVFLYLRNKTLQIWLQNPQEELAIDCLLNELPPPYNSDTPLIKRIHSYLARYGYINFGFMHLDPTKPRTLTGLVGNPVSVIARQMPMTLCKVKTRCPIFDVKERWIDPRKDQIIEKTFNNMLDACSYLAHTEGVTEVNGEKLSLGAAFEIMFKQQEKRVKEKKLEYWLTVCELREKQKKIQDEMVELKGTLRRLHAKYTESLSGEENSCVDDFEARCRRRDLQAAVRIYDRLEATRKELDLTLNELLRKEHAPSDVYMNQFDRRLLDWHIANLEFANATSLDTLSLTHWDQDDEFELTGCHLSVKEGYGIVAQRLAQDVEDLRLAHVVKSIKYTDSGVEVQCSVPCSVVDSSNPSSTDHTLVTFSGDVCLCTAPLGVLKDCLENPESEGAFAFQPPLPDWKVGAIKRLGFGNLNKVVLCFKEAFWDRTLNVFGATNECSHSRGEIFQFWNLTDAPVLLALVAGKSADIFEKLDESIIVKKCMKVLASIYNGVPDEPVEFLVTRWRSEPFSRGSYSYVSVDATGDDYDLLASPIGVASSVGDAISPKLFFAGEHTLRNYPATVHGAILSGLREAGRIADQFLGCPYSVLEGEDEM